MSVTFARGAAWSPADGPGAAAQQILPAPSRVDARGRLIRAPGALWTPSEGPCRSEPGGAGGEPDGRTIPIRKYCWD